MYMAPKGAGTSLINSPLCLTGDTVVMGTAGLDTILLTGRTGATRMEPAAVGIKVVLDDFIGNRHMVAWGESQGLFPRISFISEQNYIAFVIVML